MTQSTPPSSGILVDHDGRVDDDELVHDLGVRQGEQDTDPPAHAVPHKADLVRRVLKLAVKMEDVIDHVRQRHVEGVGAFAMISGINVDDFPGCRAIDDLQAK